jgi:predicted site-specific integrase-resolvase
MWTTTRVNWRFTFTISDLGRLLGKSPVTLRGWENKGLVDIPRDQSGDRKLGCQDVRVITDRAYEHKRINQRRVNLVYATITLMEQIEHENNWKVKNDKP